MLVDDKLAKEKLIGILDTYVWRTSDGFLEAELAQLIRNTDLTDCQQTEEKAKSDE